MQATEEISLATQNREGPVTRTYAFGDAGMQLIWTLAAVCLHSIELNQSRALFSYSSLTLHNGVKVYTRNVEWNSEMLDVQLKAVIGEVASGFGY